jgi:hypothetical protein
VIDSPSKHGLAKAGKCFWITLVPEGVLESDREHHKPFDVPSYMANSRFKNDRLSDIREFALSCNPECAIGTADGSADFEKSRGTPPSAAFDAEKPESLKESVFG